MKYRHLNLEQKLTKIRKKMPLLIKQFHSEEVGYDFSKLDDIYAFMTPALNKYGVNFDIVRETPTMMDGSGHPVYLIQDHDGYWRFEADLTLCWINADEPRERTETIIHAVGTHEIPDKAKGVAWTYALKCYLRNKFCVKQDSESEDPDMRGTDTPDEAQTEKADSVKTEKKSTGQGQNKQTPIKQEPKSGKVKEMPVKAKTEIARTEKASGEPKGTVGKPLAERKTESLVKKENSALSEEKKRESVFEPPVDEEANLQESSTMVQADGFEPVADEEEIPFDDYEDDCSFMEDLNEELSMKETEDTSAYEAARNYICTFGIFKDKTLGYMLDSGEKGKAGLKWLATSYKGSDKEMVQAAKLLLETDENYTNKKAA